MFTLQNWVVQLGLICIPSIYIGFIGAMSTFGNAIACVILSSIADKYGRLDVLKATLLLFIPMLFLLLFVRSLAFLYFFVFY